MTLTYTPEDVAALHRLLAHQAALERRHRRQFAALAAGLSGFATLAVLMLSGVL